MRYSFVVTLVKLLLLSLLSACSQPQPPPPEMPLVEVFVLPKKDLQDLQKFPAIVQASDFTALSFRVSGELIKLPVSSGQKVKKGDLIARLDDRDYQLALKDKKAKLTLAKASMGRAEKMLGLGSMPQSTFDELEAKYRIALAQYDYARLQLKYVELKAPFDGIIASVPADNYQTTAVGQVVANMHRIDKLEARVDLPDIILASADTQGDKSTIVLDLILDAYPGHVFKARYKEHTTEQSSDSKSYQLTLELPLDSNRPALQGMPGSVEIDLAKLSRQQRMVKVPLQAVVLPDSYPLTSAEKVLWRMKSDASVEAVKVRTAGLADSGHIEVFGDLYPGDKIVISGLAYLKTGLKVKALQGEMADKEQAL